MPESGTVNSMVRFTRSTWRYRCAVQLVCVILMFLRMLVRVPVLPAAVPLTRDCGMSCYRVPTCRDAEGAPRYAGGPVNCAFIEPRACRLR